MVIDTVVLTKGRREREVQGGGGGVNLINEMLTKSRASQCVEVETQAILNVLVVTIRVDT